MSLSAPRSPQPCAHTATLPRPAGWRLEVLEAPQDVTVRAGGQASFSCTLSETVPVGEATWYINGASVQPDDADWTVGADGRPGPPPRPAAAPGPAAPCRRGHLCCSRRCRLREAHCPGWVAWACLPQPGPRLWGRWVGGDAFPLQKLLGAVCGPTRGVGSGHTLPVTPVHHVSPADRRG